MRRREDHPRSPMDRWSLMAVRGEWNDVAARRWVTQGRAGLDLAETRDLSFLPTVAGLRAVRVNSRTRNDTHVADCPALEWLHLVTYCHKPLDLTKLAHLDVVDVTRRTGILGFHPDAPLSQLVLREIPHADLRFLGHRPLTTSVSVAFSDAGPDCLQGAEDVPALAGLHVSGLCAAPNLAPVAASAGLTHLALSGEGKPVPATGDLDLTPLSKLASLYQVQLYDLSITSLMPLLANTSVQRVQLFGCTFPKDELMQLTGHLRHLFARHRDGTVYEYSA